MFEMTLGIGLEQKAGSVESDGFANAGDDIGERAALRRVHEDVIGGEKRQMMDACQFGAAGKIGAHVAAIACRRRKPDTAGYGVG